MATGRSTRLCSDAHIDPSILFSLSPAVIFGTSCKLTPLLCKTLLSLKKFNQENCQAIKFRSFRNKHCQSIQLLRLRTTSSTLLFSDCRSVAKALASLAFTANCCFSSSRASICVHRIRFADDFTAFPRELSKTSRVVSRLAILYAARIDWLCARKAHGCLDSARDQAYPMRN